MRPNTNHIVGLLIAFVVAYFTYTQVSAFVHIPYIWSFAIVSLIVSLFTVR